MQATAVRFLDAEASRLAATIDATEWAGIAGHIENGVWIVEGDGEIANAVRNWLSAGGVPEAYVPPPPLPTIVRKADIYERATDAEAEAIDAAVNAAGAKLRGLWNASLEFRSDSAYWPQIVAMGEQLFGAARAAELLGPEVA